MSYLLEAFVFTLSLMLMVTVLSCFGAVVKRRQQASKASKPCSMFHFPLKHSGPYNNMASAYCGVCKKHKVPLVLLSTTDQPSNPLIDGVPELIEARVARKLLRY